jgi:hypothetical protein
MECGARLRLRRGGAVAIVLVEQFRLPALLAGSSPW